MTKLFWQSLLAAPAALGAALALSGAAVAAQSAPVEAASPEVAPVSVTALEQEPVQLAQITSVSQLSDVLPSDWAYQALQSLVENYGCIQGYPDRTFRGNSPLTRYEFAAGLNACLDVIAQLIAQGPGAEEDLATIRRLQEEFQAELNTLRGRVDALEADVAELEANQFSTTTKLR
ncbi:MAG TPA: iron uptake porin, partial [Trichocoleus sp.]